ADGDHRVFLARGGRGDRRAELGRRLAARRGRSGRRFRWRRRVAPARGEEGDERGGEEAAERHRRGCDRASAGAYTRSETARGPPAVAERPRAFSRARAVSVRRRRRRLRSLRFGERAVDQLLELLIRLRAADVVAVDDERGGPADADVAAGLVVG